MVEKKRLLVLILTCLLVSELFLPGEGWTQSFSDTGTFYYTGQHNARRSPIFREFMITGATSEGLTGEGLKVGPVRLHPFLGVAEVYTDNVFKTDTKRQSDFLTAIAPGIQALLPFGGGRHSVLLDYRAGQLLYHKFSGNNALAQDAQGHVSLNFPSGLTADFQGGHIEGFDPRGSEVDTQQPDITKWEVNSFLSQVAFSGPSAGISLKTSYLDLHYKNNGQAPRRDRTRLQASLSVSAKVTSATSALLGVIVTDYNYDKNNQLDNFGYGVFTGFELAQGRPLSGTFNIGYTVLNYDRAPLAQAPSSGLSKGAKQATSLYMQGNLHWNPTSRLNFNAFPFRTISQSVVFNTSNFIATGVNIQGSQLLTDRLDLSENFFYENDNFDGSRNDHRFRFRVGPGYRLVKWLGFRLNYIFEKRSSNEADFDFYSNTVMLSIQGIL